MERTAEGDARCWRGPTLGGHRRQHTEAPGSPTQSLEGAVTPARGTVPGEVVFKFMMANMLGDE